MSEYKTKLYNNINSLKNLLEYGKNRQNPKIIRLVIKEIEKNLKLLKETGNL